MPYNGSGSFSLAEPPFVPLTTISSAAMNSDLTDIADGLSDCLTTDGQSQMSAAIKAFAGTVVTPGYTFSTDLNTGIYRIGADNIGVTCGGTKILDIGSAGLDVTGTISQSGNPLLPVGSVMSYAGATAPGGWLLCYGQSLLRASYAALFAAIGTAYGAADGSHFSLPDMRGRVAAGKDDMGGAAAGRLTATTMTPDGVTLGATGGTQTHVLTTGELAAHTHTGGAHTHGLHTKTPNGAVGGSGPPFTFGVDGGPWFSGNGAPFGTDQGTTDSGGAVATTSVGSDTAHLNVQPSLILNYIIFAGV